MFVIWTLVLGISRHQARRAHRVFSPHRTRRPQRNRGESRQRIRTSIGCPTCRRAVSARVPARFSHPAAMPRPSCFFTAENAETAENPRRVEAKSQSNYRASNQSGDIRAGFGSGVWFFEIGAWCLFVIWALVLGISRHQARRAHRVFSPQRTQSGNGNSGILSAVSAVSAVHYSPLRRDVWWRPSGHGAAS